MKRGNPEVEFCLDHRLPICSLPELVRELLLPGKHSVVVAGTHGKTTTTSLLAWVLDHAGLDPGFLIGGIPLNFGRGARIGGPARPMTGDQVADAKRDAGPEPFFVIEGDEYDTAFFDKRSKFVHYRPDTVILNNIEFDHADIFADLTAVKRAFRQLIAIIPRRGRLVAFAGDPAVREVARDAQCAVDWFDMEHANRFRCPLPGDHNLRNAAAVVVGARSLGLTDDQIQAGFDSFRGIKRRMEVRGEVAGVLVLDDFAHHPTAIKATLNAVRRQYPGRKLWALFEPRSNTTRRNIFQAELAGALGEADGVYIAKVDRLDELPAGERLQPQQMIETLQSKHVPARFLATADEIIADLVPQLQPGDVVAVLSNGKFGRIHEKLLDALQAD